MSASASPHSTHSDDDHKARAGRSRASIALGDLGSLIPAIVAVGAALVYGVLIVSYSEFYAELGVRPREVGLEFGPGLGGVVGVSVLLILTLGALSLYLFAISRWLTTASRSEDRKSRRTWLLGALILGGLVAVVVIAAFLNDDARDSAAKARAGTPVGPLTLLGLEVVAVRADRAEITPADPKASASETYQALKDRTRLMYLGRSGSSLVLYDPSRQSSWQIPASMFTVRAVNCEEHVKPRDPICPD